MEQDEVRKILDALAEPFPLEAISWKPQALWPKERPTNALAVAYIDARDVAERLDQVLGLNWSFTWQADGENVKGRLAIRIGDMEIVREDVGEPGDGEAGSSRKAAVSDALKRCAVLFGVGRYLYRLPKERVPYDPDARQLVRYPQLPQWAIPKPKDGGAQRPAQSNAPGAAPQGNIAQDTARTAGALGRKPVIIKTPLWQSRINALRKSDVAAYYSDQHGLNAFHVVSTIAKLGYTEITNENVDEVYEKLVEYARLGGEDAGQWRTVPIRLPGLDDLG